MKSPTQTFEYFGNLPAAERNALMAYGALKLRHKPVRVTHRDGATLAVCVWLKPSVFIAAENCAAVFHFLYSNPATKQLLRLLLNLALKVRNLFIQIEAFLFHGVVFGLQKVDVGLLSRRNAKL